MVNVKSSVKDGILTLVIDLKERNGTSATGKSTCIASTKGNVELAGTGGAKLGLNLYIPVAPKA